MGDDWGFIKLLSQGERGPICEEKPSRIKKGKPIAKTAPPFRNSLGADVDEALLSNFILEWDKNNEEKMRIWILSWYGLLYTKL